MQYVLDGLRKVFKQGITDNSAFCNKKKKKKKIFCRLHPWLNGNWQKRLASWEKLMLDPCKEQMEAPSIKFFWENGTKISPSPTSNSQWISARLLYSMKRILTKFKLGYPAFHVKTINIWYLIHVSSVGILTDAEFISQNTCVFVSFYNITLRRRVFDSLWKKKIVKLRRRRNLSCWGRRLLVSFSGASIVTPGNHFLRLVSSASLTWHSTPCFFW